MTLAAAIEEEEANSDPDSLSGWLCGDHGY